MSPQILIFQFFMYFTGIKENCRNKIFLYHNFARFNVIHVQTSVLELGVLIISFIKLL